MAMNFDGRDEAEAKAAKNASKASSVKRGGGAKAKAAAQAEALSKGVEFDFDDEHYAIDSAEEWDLDVFEAAAQGDLITALRALLGDEQWQLFRTQEDEEGERVKRKRNLKDLAALWEAAQEAVGVEPGE